MLYYVQVVIFRGCDILKPLRSKVLRRIRSILYIACMCLLLVAVFSEPACAAECSDFGWSHSDSDAGSGGCWVMCLFSDQSYILVWCPICDWSYNSYSFTCGPDRSYCPVDCVCHDFYDYTDWVNDCKVPVECPYGSVGYEEYYIKHGHPQECYVCPLLLTL